MKKLWMLPLMALLMVSCEEETGTGTNPTTGGGNPSPPTPAVVANADAVLIALNVSTVQENPIIGSIAIQTGLALANFPDGNGGFKAAGMVTCEGTELTNNNNNYLFTPSATNPMGIEFDGAISWGVEGGANVKGFTETYGRELPSIGKLTGANSEVTRSAGLTFSIDLNEANTDISDADSLLFAVYDADGKSILKTQAKSSNSVTFSASELGTLKTGVGYIQANAYNYAVRTVAGDKLVFINQGSTTVVTEWK